MKKKNVKLKTRIPHARSRVAYLLTTGPDTILTLCHMNIKTKQIISAGWLARFYSTVVKKKYICSQFFSILY